MRQAKREVRRVVRESPGRMGAEEPAVTADGPAPGLSVIVRVTERPLPPEEIYREYAPALLAADPTTEFIFAVEPWARPLSEALRGLAEAGEPIQVIETLGGVGEANLLREAAAQARADIILTMPSYHRVDPAALPALVQAVRDGADLVAARRWPRADGWFARARTSAFNAILKRFVGRSVSDIGSGVHAMRRRVLEETPLYGDFFRFLPVLAQRGGFAVAEVDARQHESDRSTRMHGVGIYVRRLIDVLGLFFLVRFTEKPLRFFGLVGGLLAFIGGVMLLVLGFQRVFAGQALADRPILLVSLIAFTLGVQAIALGLIGEMIVNLHVSRGPRYRLRERDQDR